MTKRVLTALFLLGTAILSGGGAALLATCGPFTDTAGDPFCPFVLEIFYLGITTGTTATTYSGGDNVTRLQMAAFLSRSVDRTLLRGSRRAALNQFWTPQNGGVLGLAPLDFFPLWIESDGTDVWVPRTDGTEVWRIRGSDLKLVETWVGMDNVRGIAMGAGKVFVSGYTNPGKLFAIDPTQPAGAATTVATNLGTGPSFLAFDGARVWSANDGGSISIVTLGSTLPWSATTVTTGLSNPFGVLFDGANVWATDFGVNPGALRKFNVLGTVLQTVTLGAGPRAPVYDGGNIWVPNDIDASVSVVRASSGAVLATLTGNGLSHPQSASFDGERILVCNPTNNSVSLWLAAGLIPIGNFPTGANTMPWGSCSDGTRFWLAFNQSPTLARF